MEDAQPSVLGVDIGGVIIDRVNDNTDTSFFGDNYLRTTPVPGVFDALRKLVDQRFGDQVYLVSKCGQKVQNKTLQWLEHHHFYDITQIKRGHVHFCRERHQKSEICQRLRITHFIDDRLEVLSYLTTVANRYLFRPDIKEVGRFYGYLKNVNRVDSWQEILKRELR